MERPDSATFDVFAGVKLGDVGGVTSDVVGARGALGMDGAA